MEFVHEQKFGLGLYNNQRLKFGLEFSKLGKKRKEKKKWKKEKEKEEEDGNEALYAAPPVSCSHDPLLL